MTYCFCYDGVYRIRDHHPRFLLWLEHYSCLFTVAIFVKGKLCMNRRAANWIDNMAIQGTDEFKRVSNDLCKNVSQNRYSPVFNPILWKTRFSETFVVPFFRFFWFFVRISTGLKQRETEWEKKSVRPVWDGVWWFNFFHCSTMSHVQRSWMVTHSPVAWYEDACYSRSFVESPCCTEQD